MKFHALFVIFEKAEKFKNCRLLQIIGGALWVKFQLTGCKVLGQLVLWYVAYHDQSHLTSP